MPSGMPDLKRIITRISGVLLFLFFSCTIFFNCTIEPVESDLLLPVDFSNVPEDMVLTDFQTDKIEIRIKGNPRHIEMLNKETILYPADLYTDLEFDPAGDSDSIETGTYLLPVDKTRIPMNPAITILDISPSYLSVRLEKKVTKTFAINAPYIGEPAAGYLALTPACEPSSIELTGAQSLINAIDQLRTKPVDLTGANESFKKKVPLDLENPQLFSSAQSIFIVSVPIQPKLGIKTIDNIPIQIKNNQARISIEPASLSIEIKGPLDILGNKAVIDQIYAFMDLKDLKPGIYARHAYINIPVDLAMTNAVPQVFTVNVE